MEALKQTAQDSQNLKNTQDLSNTLLETFINEYLEVKNKALQGSNPLYALIDKDALYDSAKIMPLSLALSRTLKNLTQSIQEPMKIAIIGQFIAENLLF